jgi:hypothetical protein
MAIMPRVLPYSVFSAGTFNTVAAEIEHQGRACRVRRTSALTVPSATQTVVTWQTEDFDTNGGGMWNPSAPTYITIVDPGIYLIIAQVRWDDPGSSYRLGLRNNYITVNSTSVAAADTACKGNFSLPAAMYSNGEGSSVQVTARESLNAGDRVYLMVKQDCGSSIVGCHQSYGGTFLDVSRLSSQV